MTIAKSSKLSTSRKSLAWQILFVVALLMTARLLWVHRQPERLTTISTSPSDSGYFRVSGDHLVTLAHGDPSQGAGPRLQVQSLADHKTWTLVPEGPNYQLYQAYSTSQTTNSDVYLWSMADGELYYAIAPRSQFGISPNSGPIPAFGPLNTFLIPPKTPSDAKIAEQTRIPIQQKALPVQEVRFRRISLRGGSPREVAALRGENFCLIGNRLFWIRPEAEETVQVTQGKNIRPRASRVETTAHSDLMLTSLTDGKTRCIRHGISRSAGLTRMESGITWREFAPFPSKPNTFYARASDGAIYALNPLTDARFPDPLLEFGGRFYWTELTGESEVVETHEVLMSADLDGADRREVFSKVENHLISHPLLTSYRGALYCRINELSTADGDHPDPVLCRLHPDQPNPIEIVRRLPPWSDAVVQFDGGYLYFVLSEQNSRLGTNATVLYRVPLNH